MARMNWGRRFCNGAVESRRAAALVSDVEPRKPALQVRDDDEPITRVFSRSRDAWTYARSRLAAGARNVRIRYPNGRVIDVT